MRSHINKKFKREVIGRTWVAVRHVKKTIRFNKIVRKHQIETVVPYLVMSCGHTIKAKNYSGEHQRFAYCKACYDKRYELTEKRRREVENTLGRRVDENELEMWIERWGL